MALTLVFNPFTAKFDYVQDLSAYTAATPFYIGASETLTIAANKQMVFGTTCRIDGYIVTDGIAVGI